MDSVKHLSMAELEAGIDHIRCSPRDSGVLQLIVRRPTENSREALPSAELDPVGGLTGDNWAARGSSATADGSADLDAQLTIMNSRVIALLAQSPERWALAGDQLFVDLDLSVENFPPGARLMIGAAVVEFTATPHLGCKKFVARFGRDAMQFVNSPLGRELRLRGANVRIVRGGSVLVGDLAKKE